MGTAQRDSARRGMLRAVMMMAALFGGGMGVNSPESWGWCRGPGRQGSERHRAGPVSW